jgi:hypothetical protein
MTTTQKNKRVIVIVIAVVAVLVLAGAGYYLYSVGKFRAVATTGDSSKKTNETKAISGSTSSAASNGEATTPVSYQITDINKSDGSVFSLPDTISFTISPNVDSSRVRMVFQDGTTIFDKSVSGSKVSLTIYPDKKLAEGDTGTIIIDGISGGKAVVTKEVKVVF